MLKKESNAPIIWATITPHQYNKGAKLIDQRNSIAKEIVTRYDIPIDDLHTLMMGKDDYYKDQDNTHFNAEGVELQAQQIANMVLKYLNTP